jgi:hypothetical protein
VASGCLGVAKAQAASGHLVGPGWPRWTTLQLCWLRPAGGAAGSRKHSWTGPGSGGGEGSMGGLILDSGRREGGQRREGERNSLEEPQYLQNSQFFLIPPKSCLPSPQNEAQIALPGSPHPLPAGLVPVFLHFCLPCPPDPFPLQAPAGSLMPRAGCQAPSFCQGLGVLAAAADANKLHPILLPIPLPWLPLLLQASVHTTSFQKSPRPMSLSPSSQLWPLWSVIDSSFPRQTGGSLRTRTQPSCVPTVPGMNRHQWATDHA